MKATIWHNPKCGTSRNTLAMLEAAGYQVEVIEYLKTPPSRENLVELISKSGLTVRQAIREKGTPFLDLGLNEPGVSDDDLIENMLKEPVLINRPFVETKRGIRLCRPSEVVFEIIEEGTLESFTKEDGEVVTRAVIA